MTVEKSAADLLPSATTTAFVAGPTQSRNLFRKSSQSETAAPTSTQSVRPAVLFRRAVFRTTRQCHAAGNTVASRSVILRWRWNPTAGRRVAWDGGRRDSPALPVSANTASETEEGIEEEADIDVVELRRPIPDGTGNQHRTFSIFLHLAGHHLTDSIAVERESVENGDVQRVPQGRQISFAKLERHWELTLHLPNAIEEELEQWRL